jgi:hypothetical protein
MLQVAMNHGPPHTLEDYKAERRRQRWGYVLMPFFTLASIVVSVGMLMFFGKACQDRIPADAPLRTSPLFKQYQQPRKQEGGVTDPSRTTESYPAEKRGPAPSETSRGQ